MSKVNQLKNKARREEQRENWSRAIELYTQALDASRKQGEAFADLSLYNRIGDIYLRIGQKNTAVRYYEQAIERYADQDLHTSAIALCNKVLRIHPQRSTIFLQLGRLNLATNLIADARAHFHKYAEAMRERGTEEAAFEALEELIEETGDPQTLQLWISWLAAMSDEEAAIARVEERRNSLIGHGIAPDQMIERVRTGETGDIERDPVAAKRRDPLADAFLSMPEAAPAVTEDASPSADADRYEPSEEGRADETDRATDEADAPTPADPPHPAIDADLPYPAGATDLPSPEAPPPPLPFLDEPDTTEPGAAEWGGTTDPGAGAAEPAFDGMESEEPTASPSAASQAQVPEPTPLELGSAQWDDEAEELLAELNRPLEAAWSEYESEAHDPAPAPRFAPEPETELERGEHRTGPESFPAERDAPETIDAEADSGDESWSPDIEALDRDAEAGPPDPDWSPELEALDLDVGVAAGDLAADGDLADDGSDPLEADEPDAEPIEASTGPEAAVSEALENWDGLVPDASDLPPTFEEAELDVGPEAEVDRRIAELPSFEEEPPVLEEEVPEPEAAEPAEENVPDELEQRFDARTVEEPDEAEDFVTAGDAATAIGADDVADVVSSTGPEADEEPELEDDSWAAGAFEAIEAITAAEPEPEPGAPARRFIEPPTLGPSDPDIEVEPTPDPDPIGEVELAPADEAVEDAPVDDEPSLIEALEIDTLAVERSAESSIAPADGAAAEAATDEPADEMTGAFAESRLTIEEDPEDAFRDWVQSASVGVLKRALPELENRSENEKAMLVIERLSRLEDTDVEFRTRLIDSLEKLGRVEPAAEACLSLGTALQLMGRAAEARKAYERALRIRPGYGAARAALEQLGETAEDDSTEEAIPVVPTPYTPEHASADDSRAVLDTPIRPTIMPPNGNGTQDVRPYSGVAGGAEASADFEQLLSEFRAELHQKPGTTGSSSHTELGASLKEMGRLDDAIRELQAAVCEPSAPPLAYELLGEAFLEKGQSRIAIRLLEKALGTLGQGDRELMGVLYQLGRAYESATEPSKALVCYERIFSVDIDYRDIQDRILTCST